MSPDSVDIHVQWCRFSDGEHGYDYTLHVNGKHVPHGGKFKSASLAIADASFVALTVARGQRGS